MVLAYRVFDQVVTWEGQLFNVLDQGSGRVVDDLFVVPKRYAFDLRKSVFVISLGYDFSESLFSFSAHDHIDKGILRQAFLCRCGKMLASCDGEDV